MVIQPEYRIMRESASPMRKMDDRMTYLVSLRYLVNLSKRLRVSQVDSAICCGHGTFAGARGHAGDEWYRPSMRSIRGEGEISRNLAAGSGRSGAQYREQRAPAHIFTRREPHASDLCGRAGRRNAHLGA